MKIFAVRIGDRYGPEYEKYLEDKLPEYEFVWIREQINPKVLMQWNKMYAMNTGIDEPVCVIDIDMLLINDYKKIFEYPLERGEFISIPGWWRDTKREGYSLNGGFFKYYPTDCQYIYDKFMQDIDYWQNYYIKNGVTKGPINGEQYFVEDSVNEKLKLKLIPTSWVTRWCSDEAVINGQDMHTWQSRTMTKYQELTGNEYIYLGGEFHPDIKLVHFTHHANKPHDWEGYKYFV
ncbi:MAG: hypothetical protein CBE47_03295 [Pelagibacteraceae bacterium TMED287]|nr:MAG: hypothetical protein CBE47_03295 [Pelagibacteraceae bacterium TMED287]|tara:strand:+ start:501 stop:1202 length:702 start_codon:yes stop_codon:yes gene_type:complete